MAATNAISQQQARSASAALERRFEAIVWSGQIRTDRRTTPDDSAVERS
jgi:hypothetical protein